MNGKLHEIIAEIFELDVRTIRGDLGPSDVNLWDSLNHLRLITALEGEFQISFTMEEVQALDSVAAVERLVTAKTAPR